MSSDMKYMWYYAYGSNMASKVLTGRRQVYPKESIVATAPGYTLTFDILGFPYTEPSFGNISKISDKPNRITTGIPVEGVAHKITHEDYQQIKQTEGGGGNPDFGYQDVTIQLRSVKDGRMFEAHTLMVQPKHLLRGESTPSLRYLNLLREGAEEHQLSLAYREYLNSLPSYTSEQLSQKVAKTLLIVTLSPVLIPTLIVMITTMKLKLTPPPQMFVISNYMNTFSWYLYDHVLKPIFGEGE